MEPFSARSLSADQRICTRILTFGMLEWGFRLLERCLVLFLVWAVLVAFSVWLETALGLRPWPSLVLRLVGLFPLVALGFFWFRGFLRERPTLGSLSRGLEEKVPGLCSRLVTTVEFRREAALPERGILRYFSPGLVNAFFAEAQRAVRPRSLMRALARRTLAAAAAGVAIVVLAAAILPHFTAFEWETVLNVYLAPFHRSPFYDPTSLVVEPGDIQVTVGDDLTVRARLIGREARVSEIWFRTGERAPDQVRMLREEDGAFTHQFRNLQESIRYGVVAGKKRSPEYEIRVVKRIHLTHVGVLLAYPSYTGMGLGFGDAEGGSIEALIGTRCNVTAQFDEAASKAVLHLRRTDEEEAETHTRMEDSGVGWEAEFTVLADGTYSISAEWEGGSPGMSPLYTIKAIRDASPSVELLTPRRDLDLSGKRALPPSLSFHEGNPNLAIRYRAYDDLGLRESYLLIEDAERNALERVPMHVFTGRATVAEATYPWALRDRWGGEDVWISVAVKDSLAARPDLAKEFYEQDEIRQHTVTSRRVRISWQEQPRIAESGQAAKGSDQEQAKQGGDQEAIGEMEKGPQGSGTRVPLRRQGGEGGTGERAQQLARDAGEIQKEQEDLNGDATQMESGEGEQPGEGGVEPGQGEGEAAKGPEEATAEDRPEDLGERQRELAERAGELETKVRDLAATCRAEPGSEKDASSSGGKGGQGPQGQQREKWEQMAGDLDLAADRLSRRSVGSGDQLEPGIVTQMEQNAADLEKRNWDQAGRRGEEIVRDLELVAEALDRVAREAELAAREREEQQTGPGGEDERLADAVKERQQGTGETSPESAGGKGMDTQPGQDETADASSPLGGEPGETSTDQRPPQPVMRANSFTNIRFKLDEDYMTELGDGKGTVSAVPPGKREIGGGMARALEKIPSQYRDEVNRYYELLESP